jgi:hypothetical protein
LLGRNSSVNSAQKPQTARREGQAFFSERMPITRKRVITGCPAQLLAVACIFLAMYVAAGMLFALLESIYGFPDASDFDPD